FLAGLLTGLLAFAILGLQARGFRRLEATISALVGVIVIAFGLEVLRSSPSPGGFASGVAVPHFAGSDSVLLSVGILGATVMPHVIYLHSALTQKRIVPRDDAEARRLYRFTRIDVLMAMTLAGLINVSMLVMAASTFFEKGLFHVNSLEGAHKTL